MRSFLNRLFGRGSLPGPEPIRERGRPPSGNGASSLHLLWQVAPDPVRAVRATLEIVKGPRIPDLYFFALQATFAHGSRAVGGGHVGLQWNRRHPGGTAVNWGGYVSQDAGGAILAGTMSPLPSAPSDPNTRDYPWVPHRPYRLTIEPGDRGGWWRGSVEDRESGTRSVIRELDGGGDGLISPMVWAEVFAPCDAPPVVVRWSDLEVSPAPGRWIAVDRVRTNYQPYAAGGCTNTTSAADAAGGGFVQMTDSHRVNPNGAILRLPS